MLHRIFLLFFILFAAKSFAQIPVEADSSNAGNKPIAIQNRPGIIGRIGKSIYRRDSAETAPPPIPYRDQIGKVIRNITVHPLPFNVNIYDTTIVKDNKMIRLISKVHTTTLKSVVRKNVFFNEGDKVLPLQIVDNERYLRDLTFIQDANIVVEPVAGTDSVDVHVLTRDIISLGASGDGTTKWGRGLLREDNLFGSGNRVSLLVLADLDRQPWYGYGAEGLLRNVNGRFVNVSGGFSNARRALNGGRFQESIKYLRFDKPMITRYTTWTGALQLNQNHTANNYFSDSVFLSDYRYKFWEVDGWWGYNFGGRDRMYTDNLNRLRHLVAVRGIFRHFNQMPELNRTVYDYRLANIKGALLSYSLYRQNFIRSNFVYGFGRTEDIPKGLNATVTSGYIKKENRERTYYGFDLQWTNFKLKTGYFTDYIFKTSGFVGARGWEDISVLGQFNTFTPLKEFKNPDWLNRNFFTTSYTRQIKPVLDAPLFIRGDFGLPYFKDFNLPYHQRFTLRGESVFYYLRPFWGFKFAPFLFTDFVAVNGGIINEKIKGYPAFGTGVRTRNESLVFGTVEFRFYYMPVTLSTAKNFKVDVTANLRFKYNSRFVHMPEFVNANNHF